MSAARQYDLIVFGATGFTGQYVSEEIARIADAENVTWAVSGRNTGKMKTILENVEKSTGKGEGASLDSLAYNGCWSSIFLFSCFLVSGKSLKNVGIIKADVSDSASLGEMAKQGRIVLNCVGPYRLDDAKTHENLVFLFLNIQCH